ncbi:MAG: hypothetical protein OEZ01_02990 [Candidatus Heimdallarchaeota archaeon]|nr:hypothetical protein [Candidatus Heimdallarchaeota archaeon]
MKHITKLSLIVFLILLGGTFNTNSVGLSQQDTTFNNVSSPAMPASAEMTSTSSTPVEKQDASHESKNKPISGIETNYNYEANIPYSSSYWLYSYDSHDDNYTIEWYFTYSNNVPLTVLLIDSNQYYNYIFGYTYTSYLLSENQTSDSGSYVIPYNATWYVAFINNDSFYMNAYFGNVGMTFINNNAQTVYLRNINYYTFSSDTDGYSDSIQVTFDINLNFGTCQVATDLYLYDEYGGYINSVYQEFNVTGTAVDYFYMEIGPVFMDGNYSITLYTFCYDEPSSYDWYASSTFELIATSRPPTVYFQSYWYDYYDTDTDGYYDTVEVIFDINVEFGNETAVVYAYLYDSNGVAVDGLSYSYDINGRSYDAFSITFSAVSIHDYYDVELLLYRSGDLDPSDSAHLYAIELGVPVVTSYFSNAYFSRNDYGSDGTYESVNVIFDPDLTTGSGNVHVIAFLYFGSNIVQQLSGDYFVYGSDYENFQINFNQVNQNGYYSIELQLYYSDASIPDDYWNSNSFQLTPNGNIPSSSNPSSSSNSNSSDTNNSTGNNDPLAGLPFSNGLVILLSLGFATVFRTVLRNKNKL